MTRCPSGRRSTSTDLPLTLTRVLDPALAGFDDVIDVRSPAEYAEDHLPGAISLPVLDDADLTSLDDVRAEATSPSQAWRELAPDVRRDDDALARDVIEFIDDIAGFVAHGPQAFFESNASMPYLSTQMLSLIHI